jgi:hypothetical protein
VSSQLHQPVPCSVLSRFHRRHRTPRCQATWQPPLRRPIRSGRSRIAAITVAARFGRAMKERSLTVAIAGARPAIIGTPSVWVLRGSIHINGYAVRATVGISEARALAPPAPVRYPMQTADQVKACKKRHRIWDRVRPPPACQKAGRSGGTFSGGLAKGSVRMLLVGILGSGISSVADHNSTLGKRPMHRGRQQPKTSA